MLLSLLARFGIAYSCQATLLLLWTLPLHIASSAIDPLYPEKSYMLLFSFFITVKEDSKERTNSKNTISQEVKTIIILTWEVSTITVLKNGLELIYCFMHYSLYALYNNTYRRVTSVTMGLKEHDSQALYSVFSMIRKQIPAVLLKLIPIPGRELARTIQFVNRICEE